MVKIFVASLTLITLLLGIVQAEDWGRKQVNDLVAKYPSYQTTNYIKTLQLLRQIPSELREIFHLREIIIYKNKLYARSSNSSFPYNVWANLKRLTNQATLPDTLMIFVDRDEMPPKLIKEYIESKHLDDQESKRLFELFDNIPMIMASKDLSNSLEKTNLVLPDKYVMDVQRFEGVMQNIEDGGVAYPWESRLHRAFWRGQPTGAKIYEHSEDEIISDIPNLFSRAQLVKISQQHPELLDARFVVYFEQETDILKRLNWTDYKARAVNIKEHLRYKYQVSVDGYTATWERIPWILHSGCVLFKQKSSIVQWFYDRLLPGVHYVEVAHDLSDLAQKLKYYLEHEEEARAIGQRGKEFAREYLTREAMDKQYREILEEFSRLQKLKLTLTQNFIIEYTEQINIFDLLENEDIGIRIIWRKILEYGMSVGGFIMLVRSVYLAFGKKYYHHLKVGSREYNEDNSEFVKDIDA